MIITNTDELLMVSEFIISFIACQHPGCLKSFIVWVQRQLWYKNVHIILIFFFFSLMVHILFVVWRGCTGQCSIKPSEFSSLHWRDILSMNRSFLCLLMRVSLCCLWESSGDRRAKRRTLLLARAERFF